MIFKKSLEIFSVADVEIEKNAGNVCNKSYLR